MEAQPDTALEPDTQSTEPTPDPNSERGFVCNCEKVMRSACAGLPFYGEHESRRYCVLHYPGKQKSIEFKVVLDSKLNKADFDFSGVWFPEKVDFGGFEFSADADFRHSTFRADADFTYASFLQCAAFDHTVFDAGAFFGGSTFIDDASFDHATFREDVDLSLTWFKAHASFSAATFSAAADFYMAEFRRVAYFYAARFSGPTDFNLSVFHGRADFRYASFDDSIHFLGSTTERQLRNSALAAMALGEEPALDFQHVRIERPNRIAFHTLNLRPHWFANVDSRQFVFTDVGWEWDRISIKEEIAALETNQVSSPNRLLAITCRQLAENAESNNRYEEASHFRYWAMDLARHTKWKRWWFWKTDWLHILYWAVSGYGERILRALGVLVAILIVFALLYTKVGFDQPLPNERALTYSLAVMSLQKPEPKPLTGTAQALVLLETILGPVQAALLALAIRRQFMR